MTVSTTVSVKEYVAGGPAFPIPYRFLQDSDIQAILVKQDGTEETLALGTQYTLTGVGESQGGTLTSAYAAAVLSTPGAVLSIARIMAAVQPTDLRNQGRFYAETHEVVFDRLTMLIQQFLTAISRALSMPFGRNYYDAKSRQIKNLAAPSDPADATNKAYVDALSQSNISYVDGEIRRTVRGQPGESLTPLPNAGARASKVLAFDEAGNPIAVIPVSGTAEDLAIALANKTNPDLGLGMSGYKGRTAFQRLSELPHPSDYPFSAVGDGVTNDTASFASFESQYFGRTVDLGGKTFLVNARPLKNNYINGKFKVGNATFSSDLYNGFLSAQPKFTAYGQQLRSLKEDLGNPLVQYIGVAGVGDSLLWGRTLPDNSTVSPQTQLLTTARDNASSPSFWNNVRRYIADEYMKGSTETRSNWAASPSGESVVTLVKKIVAYPKDGPFTIAVTGSSQSVINASNGSTISGWRYTLADGSPGGASNQAISFTFTGTQFDFVFQCSPNDDNNNYDVLIDGVLAGTYSTQPGVDGIVIGYNQRRTHTFSYVQNKTITIRTNSTGFATVRRLYIEGLEIPKTVRFTNQGVIGLTARTYDLYNLSGSYSNPTAVTATDKYIFCQFGTNDRGDTAVPPGVGEFQRSMQQILNRLMPLGNVILMCASPVADSNEPPAPGYMTMRDVRGVINKVAKSNSLAFIDNLAAFESVDPSVILDGAVHPNALGHAIIARNIINSLECS